MKTKQQGLTARYDSEEEKSRAYLMEHLKSISRPMTSVRENP
jgi:hypothetical protein